MAAQRGLNKGRGLETLFPQKISREKPSGITTGQPVEKLTEQTSKQPAEKPAEQATKKPAEKLTEQKSGKPAEKPAGHGAELPEKETDRPTEKKATSAKAAGKVSGKSGQSKKPVSGSGTKTSSSAKASASGTKTPASGTKAAAAAGKAETDHEAEKQVRVSQIIPNQDQPRKDFDPESIKELAESIRQHGVIQPLLVQKKGRYYEIIAGERRWRAAREAGLKTVPVLLRNYSEQESAEISLIENIQRENLNAIEEAKAYKKLQDEYGLKQEELAGRVSKSRAAVANALRLLKLEPEVQQLLVEGKLTYGHARALLPLEDADQQKKAAASVAARELSVRETEKMVRKMLAPPEEAAPAPVSAKEAQARAVLQSLEDRLRTKTGTRVSISERRPGKGKIEIEYYSADDLERILELFGEV